MKSQVLETLKTNTRLRGIGNDQYYNHMQLMRKALIIDKMRIWVR